MSEILTYSDGFKADGTILKQQTNGAKGGRLIVALELPQDGELGKMIINNIGNVAEVSVRFSSHKASTSETEDPNQMTLDDLEDQDD